MGVPSREGEIEERIQGGVARHRTGRRWELRECVIRGLVQAPQTVKALEPPHQGLGDGRIRRRGRAVCASRDLGVHVEIGAARVGDRGLEKKAVKELGVSCNLRHHAPHGGTRATQAGLGRAVAQEVGAAVAGCRMSQELGVVVRGDRERHLLPGQRCLPMHSDEALHETAGGSSLGVRGGRVLGETAKVLVTPSGCAGCVCAHGQKTVPETCATRERDRPRASRIASIVLRWQRRRVGDEPVARSRVPSLLRWVESLLRRYGDHIDFQVVPCRPPPAEKRRLPVLGPNGRCGFLHSVRAVAGPIPVGGAREGAAGTR